MKEFTLTELYEKRRQLQSEYTSFHCRQQAYKISLNSL